jgi:hypothetical protein
MYEAKPADEDMLFVHVETDTCSPWHCNYHDVDEFSRNRDVYMRCYECWHLYETRAALIEAFCRQVIDKIYTGWWRRLWERINLSDARMFFCPYCAHNF